MSRSHAPVVVGLVSGSHVINHAYMLLFAPAFPLLRVEFNVSLAQLGLALGVVSLVITVGQLPLGHLSDSYSHGIVLIGCLLVGTIGTALAALAPSYEWLLLSAAIIGLGVAGHHPAHYPLISASTPDAYRSRAYSAHGFAGAIGLALPFAAVPAAVALGFGWREAFGTIAVLGLCYTIVAVVTVARLPRSITRAGAEARSKSADDRSPKNARTSRPRHRALGHRVGDYLRGLVGAPLILLLTALWFVNGVAAWGIRTYAATLLDVGYGLPTETASLIASAMLVVGAFVLLGGGYLADRFGALSMLFVGYGSLAVLAVLASSALLPVVAAVGVVLLLAATLDLSRPARATITDRASGRGKVGTNFALVTIGISAGGAIAPPAFGYIIEIFGVGAAFLAVASTAVLAFFLSIAVARMTR